MISIINNSYNNKTSHYCILGLSKIPTEGARRTIKKGFGSSILLWRKHTTLCWYKVHIERQVKVNMIGKFWKDHVNIDLCPRTILP